MTPHSNMITSQQAQDQLRVEDAGTVPALVFTSVSSYTTFYAEYAIDNGNLIFHFFRSPELEKLNKKNRHWEDTFPVHLDQVARDFFKMDYPRLRATLVDNVLRADADEKEEGESSWWLKANGVANTPDPSGLAELFISKLDQSLDTVKVT